MKKELSFGKRMKSHHDSTGLVRAYSKPSMLSKEDFVALLEERPDERPKAIYVHTPYCDKICSFCNLNRKQLEASLRDYAEDLAEEFRSYGRTRYVKESRFAAIFFGGGTPSVYSKAELQTILSALQENVNLEEDYEFTFESTLHNLDEEKLKLLMDYGVNRLSIGIQSFSERGRKFYNRSYGKEESIARLRKIQEIFRGSVCIDIIYNFPGQTKEEVIEDAKIIKDLGLASVSFYSLMIQEGSQLSKVEVLEEEGKDYLLYQSFVEEMLKDKSYYVLELTKIAKKEGDQYRYIQIRKHGGDTLPVGLGAGGSVQDVGIYHMAKGRSFYMKTSDLAKRFSRLSGLLQFPILEKKKIEEILTREEYRSFMKKMQDYLEAGLVREEGENYLLTEEGIYWGNNMSSDLASSILQKLYQKLKQIKARS